MIAVLAGAALAADLAVGLPVGPDRFASSVLTTDWATGSTSDTRKCWTRGPAEVCLATTPSEGKTPLALVEGARSSLTVVECQDAGTATSPHAAQAFCHVRDGLQEQNRYWGVVVDGPYAIWTQVKFTGVDEAADADTKRFLERLDVRSPSASATLDKPTCKGLADGLAASVDRFAGVKGERDLFTGGYVANLAWPGAKRVEIVEDGGKTSLRVVVLGAPTPEAAIAGTQSLMTDLAACDVWCAEIALAEASTPTRREITYTPKPSPTGGPRCAATSARVVLEDTAGNPLGAGAYTLTFWIDAP